MTPQEYEHLTELFHAALEIAPVERAAFLDERKAYDDFFTLWKDADADLPVLIEAKKEYEKLK